MVTLLCGRVLSERALRLLLREAKEGTRREEGRKASKTSGYDPVDALEGPKSQKN